MCYKYDPEKLFLEEYDYGVWSEKEESTNKEKSTDVPTMPSLKGDEKEGKWLKTLTLKKLLTRLPVLLSKIKVEIIHANWKTKSDKYCINFINTIKIPKKFTTS